MMRYFIVFLSGIVVTYIGNFIYCTIYFYGRGTGFFISNSFISALPDLMKLFWFLIVCVALVLVVRFLIFNNAHKNKEQIICDGKLEVDSMLADTRRKASDIIADAYTRAFAIPKEAKKEASISRQQIKDEFKAAQNLRNQLELELRELENSYQEAFDKLKKDKQAYLDEIAGLQRKIERLELNLRKAKKSGIKKLQEQVPEGATIRAEKN